MNSKIEATRLAKALSRACYERPETIDYKSLSEDYIDRETGVVFGILDHCVYIIKPKLVHLYDQNEDMVKSAIDYWNNWHNEKRAGQVMKLYDES